MIRRQIRQKISQVKPFKKTLLDLMNVFSSDNYQLCDVVAVIEKDSVLSAKLISFCNSARYSLREHVNSIDRAVTMLGEKLVISLSMGEASRSSFARGLEGYDARQDSFWVHSVKTAIAARLLCAHSRVRLNPGLCYTAGLLHDIGKSVISDLICDALGKDEDEIDPYEIAKELGKEIQDRNIETNFLELEKSLAGLSHDEASALIAKEWSLSDLLIQALEFHHSPALALEEAKPLVYCVHLADIVAMAFGGSTGADMMRYCMDEGYINYLELDDCGLENIIARTDEEFESLVALSKA